MNISVEKLDIIQKICEIQDTDFIDLIKNIVAIPYQSKKDWWTEITPEERESINRGLDDLDNGKVYPHDQIRKRYEKWLED
jgi:hypothetical protein